MSEDGGPISRAANARAAARSLIDAMEVEEASIDRCLMIAQRLARLMRDSDAQTWLDFEQRGYPDDLAGSRLGSCGQYAFRFRDGKVVVTASLPQLEAASATAETVLNKMAGPTMGAGQISNHIVAQATRSVMVAAEAQLTTARNAYLGSLRTYKTQRSALHRWAADTLIALELGDAAEGIFERARLEVDKFVRSYAPKAGEQLVAVSERMRERSPESFSAALTSCRRLIMTVADALFPPRAAPHVDGNGKKREVGSEQYKNRLVAFIEQRIASGSTKAILEAQLAHLIARLEANYEKACKGVHADVSEDEARLVVIETYIFLAEVARFAPPPTHAAEAPTASQ